MMRASRRWTLAASLLAGVAVTTAAACGGGAGTDPSAPARTFRLGFSALPPRPNIESVLATIAAWRTHADCANLSLTPPWKALLADTSAAFLVRRDVAQLAGLYRSRGLPLFVQVDATDGLAREREAPELVALGRSIAEPAVQAAYREWVLAVDSIVHPEYLGLAMEVNLVRAIAPAGVYAALRAMTGATAAALMTQGTTSRLFVSVQVETAWGRLPATGSYVGVAADRRDFPFIQALGLSSYPFLGGFAEPEDVPEDYFARVTSDGGPALPAFIMEGGWTSASVTGVTSSPEKQARWIRRQAALADRASLVAITQITFTDLDLDVIPLPPGSIVPLFAAIGLVDEDLRAKPALAEWDRVLRRPLRQP
jgi:hypothetical protein